MKFCGMDLHSNNSVVSCSGGIDLKFGAVCVEQAANFVVDGFLRPADEVAPMVFGLYHVILR